MRISMMAAAGAVLAMTVAGAAAAQTPPANAGPYYIVDGGADNAFLIAGGTRGRRGDIGTVTAVVLISEAKQEENIGVARLDMAYEFQCGPNRLRNTSSGFYRADGSLIEVLVNEPEWEAVSSGATSETMKRYACDGTLPADAEPYDDLGSITQVYLTWAAQQ
ncbi:hypothetical protein [Brevundimonas sp.]|uniref:hypothetical protein n=1 Tax=Brevundimonas sp. TaxID=1871086 RepID=UPI002AB94520|nr:hypothetical protein [Brevundimonas sp.]MDZ4364213.1 hypothetical protein [Brevundimonas sp.]